jgi:AcrR family transcriptional regulator
LLEVARLAFATYGYDATTNKDIAAEAGITTGAIYHYFSSKADLYVAAHERVQAIAYAAFEDAVAGVTTLPDRLNALLDTAVALSRDDPTLAGFVVNVSWELQRHEELRERMRATEARGRVFFESLVADAAARGELPPNVEESGVVDMIRAVIAGLARFSSQTGDPARHGAATEAMKALIDGRLFSR